MREFFRGLIWNRPPIKEKGKPSNYRYVIVGILVTDESIENIEEVKKGEVIISQEVSGLASILAAAKRFKSVLNVGTADDFLLGMERLQLKNIGKRDLKK